MWSQWAQNIGKNLVKEVQITVTYPSEIKVGDLIRFDDGVICPVKEIRKGQRHSREDGYPYEFIGELDGKTYKKVYWRDVTKYIRT